MPKKPYIYNPNYQQEQFDAGNTQMNEQDEDDDYFAADQEEQDEDDTSAEDEQIYIDKKINPSERRYLTQKVKSSITEKQVNQWNKATKKQLKVK